MRVYRTSERKVNAQRGERNGRSITVKQAFERGRQAAMRRQGRTRHAYSQPQVVAAFERGYDSVVAEQRQRKEAGR